MFNRAISAGLVRAMQDHALFRFARTIAPLILCVHEAMSVVAVGFPPDCEAEGGPLYGEFDCWIAYTRSENALTNRQY